VTNAISHRMLYFTTFFMKLLTVCSGVPVIDVVFSNACDCVHRRIPGARYSLSNVLRRHGAQHSSIDGQIHSISAPTSSHILYPSLSGDARFSTTTNLAAAPVRSVFVINMAGRRAAAEEAGRRYTDHVDGYAEQVVQFAKVPFLS
jgi:hypothetical protein